MYKLSVCIVTYNEEKNIRDCLNSVKWADEIIIVDSFSTDLTVAIAKKFTYKITQQKWEGCGLQKQRATNLATNEWILILDADERLSEELQEEIKNIVKTSDTETTDDTKDGTVDSTTDGTVNSTKDGTVNSTKDGTVDGYVIPFKSYYCNKQIRFGDWMLEKHLRLYKKKCANVVPRIIHFRIDFSGKIANLKGYIHHYSFPNLEKVLHKMNQYSTDGAIHQHQKHKKACLIKAIVRGLFAFMRGYILKLGFLDGRAGFMLAVSNAEGAYYKYAKLMLLNSSFKDLPSKD